MFDYNYIIASYSQGREFSSKWYRFKKKFWTILRFADSVIKCYINFFKSEKNLFTGIMNKWNQRYNQFS